MLRGVELSVVIPVFNGSDSIGPLVEEIHVLLNGRRFEVLLVNDGSSDASERVGCELAERHPDTVSFLQLARNFGEHHAVLAGLRASAGDYVVVLDDDGQNPPAEAIRLFEHAKNAKLDVVYGRYLQRKHSRFRMLGSWLNDKAANWALHKPRGLYLSSFKVMSRFLVDELCKYSGAFPYLDGMIFRITDRVGQVDVMHCERKSGRSGYTLGRLVGLWLNMLLGFSVLPLRLAMFAGLAAAASSFLFMAAILVDKLWINPEVTVGIPTALCAIAFFGGVQLAVLGTLGEYIGRVFLQNSGTPQLVVRYVCPRRNRFLDSSDAMPVAGDGSAVRDRSFVG